MTWHQWHAAYPMLRKIGRSRSVARASASGPHGNQSTGLWACWRRYGLVSPARRLGMSGWYARVWLQCRDAPRPCPAAGCRGPARGRLWRPRPERHHAQLERAESVSVGCRREQRTAGQSGRCTDGHRHAEPVAAGGAVHGGTTPRAQAPPRHRRRRSNRHPLRRGPLPRPRARPPSPPPSRRRDQPPRRRRGPRPHRPPSPRRRQHPGRS